MYQSKVLTPSFLVTVPSQLYVHFIFKSHLPHVTDNMSPQLHNSAHTDSFTSVYSFLFQEFNREVKGFVFSLEGSSYLVKMQLPANDRQSCKSMNHLQIPFVNDWYTILIVFLCCVQWGFTKVYWSFK